MQEQQTAPPRRPLMKTREVAAYLRVSTDTVLDRARRGLIPCAGGNGDHRRFDPDLIEAYARGELKVIDHGTR